MRRNGCLPIVNTLHEKLKPRHIWLWPGGDFESHLGLGGKKQLKECGPCLQKLESQPLQDSVADYVKLKACSAWLRPANPVPKDDA